jgi:hypothetical protein
MSSPPVFPKILGLRVVPASVQFTRFHASSIAQEFLFLRLFIEHRARAAVTARIKSVNAPFVSGNQKLHGLDSRLSCGYYKPSEFPVLAVSRESALNGMKRNARS